MSQQTPASSKKAGSAQTREPWSPVNLAGRWLLRADPDDRGLNERWWSSEWPGRDETIDLPAPFQKTLGPDYHGIAWFARIISIPRDWFNARGKGQRLWLRFEAVATDATVWVNGIQVGRHVGDYVPFQFDITDAAERGWRKQAPLNPADEGQFNICIRVDEIRGSRPAPGTTIEGGHITKGFHDVLSLQHGGIWGDIILRRTGPRAIIPNGIRVLADPATRRIQLKVELDGVGAGEALTFSILGPGGEPVLAASDFLSGSNTWEREFQVGKRGDIVLVSHNPHDPDRLNLSLSAPDQKSAAKMEEEVPILPWFPDQPHLYTLVLDVVTRSRPDEIVESHSLRFGFRTVTTGGPEGKTGENRHILLNNKPLLIRGILHWGHEPDHIAPAPTPDQVRAEFARLRQMGFNCVCLCMWYPPPHYFDIADEMGMLIWQEHPVWKSPMEEELIPEYKAMFERFFRRDFNHPSVIIVSASCEHERIHPDLAAWWWKRAKEQLPDRLLQIQTAFLAWTNPHQTDLHDEHVYESSGRWARFCDDLEPTLAELPPKPFVMGETIIGTSWVDTSVLSPEVLSPESQSLSSWVPRRSAAGQQDPAPQDSGLSTQDSSPPDSELSTQHPASPWWTPKGLDACRALERAIESRYGPATLALFKSRSHRLNIEQRKFQSELLRMVPRCAGWVMNQIRDVPAGRLGFMDDLGRWRFTPDQTLPFLSPAILLLRTPDHRRAFLGNQSIRAEIGISNFSDSPFEGPVELRLASQGHERDLTTPIIKAAPGEVAWVPIDLPLPPLPAANDRPIRVNIRALAPGIHPNGWDLFAFPPIPDVPDGVIRLDGLPFSRKDHEPEFEERSYSSGWGMRVRSWKALLPFPETIVFKAPPWRFDAPLPAGTRIIITHKLTTSVLDFLAAGGRVLLLANQSPGGLGTQFLSVWGQVPLIIDTEGPLVCAANHASHAPRATDCRLGQSVLHDLDSAGHRSEPSILPNLDTHSSWIADLLHHDLTRRYTRTIPVETLGIADQVDPIIRLVFTHDTGAPRLCDQSFATRVGKGILLATSLDHSEDPGRYLLQLFLNYLADEDNPPSPPSPRTSLDINTLRAHAIH